MLAASCAYALEFAAGVRGGSRVCVTSSPNLCLDVTGYFPGNGTYFVENSDVLFTYIYKGLLLWKKCYIIIDAAKGVTWPLTLHSGTDNIRWKHANSLTHYIII